MTDELNLNPDDEPKDDETLFIPKWITEAVEQQKERPTTADKLNYAQFREDSKQGWEDVAGYEELPQQVSNLVKASILLPRQSFQLPLAAAYLMLPSALCNRVPILFSHGASGSGKSTLGFIACAIHDAPPISAGSTFASIRNIIKTVRVWDKNAPLEHVGNERNACLVWEDIKPDDLSANDGNIFSLLKNGVERSGTITIAELGGTNLTFKVFCPKLISSIHSIYAQLQFRELVRRMIIIQHKPVDKWSVSDYDDETRDSDSLELIDLSDLDFNGLRRTFREYWEDEARLEKWVSTSRSLASIKNHGMTNGLYKMSRDLICCGLVCGVWSSTAEALRHVAQYWKWHESNIESQSSATQKALSYFVQQRTSERVRQNQELTEKGLAQFTTTLEIDASELKRHVDNLKAQGELDTQANTADINNAMQALGWVLKPNALNKNSWQPLVN